MGATNIKSDDAHPFGWQDNSHHDMFFFTDNVRTKKRVSRGKLGLFDLHEKLNSNGKRWLTAVPFTIEHSADDAF